MAKIWINPVFQKKDLKTEDKISDTFEKNSEKTSFFSYGPQKRSRKFLQKLIDTNTQTTIVFYDGSSTCGKLKWFDNQSICFEQGGKEMIFDSKNIIYYRS